MPDSSGIKVQELIRFSAQTKAPLQILMPDLGYQLQVDLVYFSVENRDNMFNKVCQVTGYYYFQSTIEGQRKHQQRKIYENRNKAFFCSQQHFCRSLYQQKLNKNGYRVFQKTDRKGTQIKEMKEVPIDSMIIFKNGLGILPSCWNKEYYVVYFQNRIGFPLDLTRYKGRKPIVSKLVIEGDQIVIRPDGSTPGCNFAFGQVIGSKQIGAMLPNNYDPYKE